MRRLVWCIGIPEGVLAAAAAVLGVACGGGTADGVGAAWTSAVDTVGDTIVVRTLGGSVWGDTATLTPEMRIGVLDGADEYMLGQVNSVAVAPGGEIYVMDAFVPALRKYGADGRYLDTFGREGGGPGEYKRPDGGLAVLSDGRVVLRDPRTGQLIVYAADGEYLDGWRVVGGFSTSERLYVDTADNVYTKVLLETGKPPWEWTYGLARYTSHGEHTDTLIAPTWDYERPSVKGSNDDGSSSTSIPFTPGPSWAFSPLGYWVGGLSTDYQVDLYRSGMVLRIAKAWQPVPVLSEEAAEQEARIRDRFQREFPGWRWNGPSIPDTKPPFDDVFVGDEGRIWVRVSRSGYEAVSRAEAQDAEARSGRPQLRYREPAAFDVFEPDGRFLGHVLAPAEFRTDPSPTFRGDTVWAVARDELDVMYVVRYRLAFGSSTTGGG